MPDQTTPQTPEAPAGVPAKPVAPAARPEAAALTPLQMIPAELKTFLEEKLATGDPVTIEARKESFTGRIFRLMLEEGWIALEHEDGRRRAVFVIEAGRVTDGRRELKLGSAGAAGHAP